MDKNVNINLGVRGQTMDGKNQQGATLYDVPTSAPVGRCSARKTLLVI